MRPDTLHRPRRSTMVAVLAILVLLVAAPFMVSDFLVYQTTQVLVYAIALLGLNLLTGFNGQISLGHGAFYGMGAYAAAILIGHAEIPYWAAVPLAGAVCFVVGFLFGLPALRLEGPYLALATFGLAVAMPQILKLDKLEKWTGGVQGIVIDKPDSPLADALDADRWLYFLTLALVVALYVVGWNLVRGRTGRALVAIRDHPIAAAAMGINTPLYKSLTFGVSALYTGIAGALSGFVVGFIGPDSFTILLSINFLVGIVVGGVASIFGNFFGAAFIVLVPNVANDISDAAPGAIFGALLILFIVFMPRGIAGLVRDLRLRRRATRRPSPS